MRTENQQEKIKDIQAKCEIHWLVNRISQDRAEEMTDGLGQHLEEAVEDGKTVEDVVRPDIYEFAESWAEEDRPVWTAKDSFVEFVFALSFMTAFVVTTFHLFRWGLVIPVHWLAVPELLIFAGLMSRPFRGPTSEDNRPRWRRWLWPSAAILLVAVALLTRDAVRPILEDVDMAITGNSDGILFTWPWYGTLASVAACLTLGSLRKGGADDGD